MLRCVSRIRHEHHLRKIKKERYTLHVSLLPYIAPVISFNLFLVHMRVDHCGLYIHVPEHSLNTFDWHIFLNRSGRYSVAESMRDNILTPLSKDKL